MHNSEIRWLFDQINVGAYAIIDNSDKTFVQIAAKYGIKLAGVESQNIKNLKRAYNEFINLLNAFIPSSSRLNTPACSSTIENFLPTSSLSIW